MRLLLRLHPSPASDKTVDPMRKNFPAHKAAVLPSFFPGTSSVLLHDGLAHEILQP